LFIDANAASLQISRAAANLLLALLQETHQSLNHVFPCLSHAVHAPYRINFFLSSQLFKQDVHSDVSSRPTCTCAVERVKKICFVVKAFSAFLRSRNSYKNILLIILKIFSSNQHQRLNYDCNRVQLLTLLSLEEGDLPSFGGKQMNKK